MKNRARLLAFLLAGASLAVLAAAGCSKGPPKHGTKLTVAPTNSLPSAEQQEALARAAVVLRKRFDLLGVGRAFVEQSAEGSLLITLPRLSADQLARCRDAIENVGLLEFRMVHPESDALIPPGIKEPGYEVMTLEQKVKTHGSGGKYTTQSHTSKLLVGRKPERGLTGRYIKRTGVVRDQISSQPKITFEFDPAGTELMARITTEYSPKNGREYRLAIVVNGRLITAPTIKSSITEGRAEISGDFTLKEAIDLAAALENPLDVPLRIVEEREF